MATSNVFKNVFGIDDHSSNNFARALHWIRNRDLKKAVEFAHKALTWQESAHIKLWGNEDEIALIEKINANIEDGVKLAVLTKDWEVVERCFSRAFEFATQAEEIAWNSMAH